MKLEFHPETKFESKEDGGSESIDPILKASRALLEACLQGHLSVGPVGWACVGLAAAGLTVAGKMMGERAADLDDAELARAAKVISGLSHTAGAVSAVDSAVGVVQDPVGSMVNSLINASSEPTDLSQASAVQHRVEDALDKIKSIGKENAEAAE